MNALYSLGGAAAVIAAGLALANDPPAPPIPAPPVVTEVSPPACPPAPTVIVDGVAYPPGPEVVVRGRTPGTGSANVIVGSGNGAGNTIIVDGAADALTVVRNARNGVGNRIVIGNGLEWFDVPFGLGPPAAAPPVPVYKGKANRFWAERAWSEADDCYLYWSERDRAWFRYHREDDSYRPVPGANLPAPRAIPPAAP